MGRHRLPEQKKLSFIASSGGLLGGLALTVILLATTGVITSDDPDTAGPPGTRIPEVIEQDRNGGTGNSSTPQIASTTQPTDQAPETSRQSQEPVRPPNDSTHRPVPDLPEPPLVPLPPITEPIPPVRGDVEVPGIADIDLDIDTRKGLDVDLDIDVPLLKPVTDTVKTIPDLINKLLGE